MNIHRQLWCYVPAALVAGWSIFENTAPREVVLKAYAESSILEASQTIIIFLGLLAAIYQLTKIDFRRHKMIALWFILAAIGCFYIAGEEISWGQWIFHWDTPKSWGAINDQNETNLHNISTWLDQKPRALLEFAIVLSGWILPLLNRKNPALLPLWIKHLLPGKEAALLTGIYVLIKLGDVIGDYFGVLLFLRISEIVEFILYYYILAYIIDFDTKRFTRPSS